MEARVRDLHDEGEGGRTNDVEDGERRCFPME
jgi:hypothetical protein